MTAIDTATMPHVEAGFAALARRDLEAAIESAQSLMRMEPESGVPMFMLGLAAYFADDLGRAIQFMEEGHKREPDYRQYVDALAVMNARAGKLAEGIYFAKLATALDEHPVLGPHEPEDLRRFFSAMRTAGKTTYYLDAVCSYHARRPAEAVDYCERELRLNPRNADCHALYGQALAAIGLYDSAVSALHAAIHLDPAKAEYRLALAEVLKSSGRLLEAADCARAAMAQAPEDQAARAAHAGLLAYLPGISDAAVAAAACLPASAPGKAADPDKPRLTIGYLVGAQAVDEMFDVLEALFASHSLSGITVHGYQQYNHEDPKTDRLRSLAGVWRAIYDIDDDTLQAVVEGDGVDILVDLCGLTRDNRREALAKRLAPVQLGWLGFPLGGAPGAMDYVLSTPATLEADRAAGAKPWPVEGALMAALGVPVTLATVVASPSPAAEAGFVTFGGVADLARLAGSAGLWARVLQAVPYSRLLLGHRPAETDAAIARVLEVFSHHGVSHRLDFQATPENDLNDAVFWQQVDVFLDTTPVNGPFEAMQALSVGVPVVSLTGQTRAGALTAGVLASAGRPLWAAADEAGFVAVARALSADIAALAKQRGDLADAVATSPLLDAQAFAKAMEAAYRGIWKDACGE